MNIHGRPTRPVEASPARRGSFTGNRALDMEEALIFETGRLDASGVDIEDVNRLVKGFKRVKQLFKNMPDLKGLKTKFEGKNKWH